MASPDLKGIIRQMESGEEFSMTEKQYIRSTGMGIPKSPWYLKNRSAVAKAAKKNGYKITIQERTISFEKGP